MTTTAIALLLVSAFTHAGWNLVIKHQQPCVGFILLANTVGVACLLPVLAWNAHLLADIPPSVWWMLLATSLCLAAYYAALTGAYRRGHMSVAYPLARSLPIVVIPLVTLMRGNIDRLSPVAVAGMAVVVMGGICLPMKRPGDLNVRNYLNATCLLALLAGFGTVSYTLLDNEALQILIRAPGSKLPRMVAAPVYCCLEMILSSVWLSLLVATSPRRRKELAGILVGPKTGVVVAGVGISFTYVLVLVAMGYVTDVSYVAAFRQFSIMVGAVLGIVALNEPRYMPKLVGVGLIFAGLVLVSIG